MVAANRTNRALVMQITLVAILANRAVMVMVLVAATLGKRAQKARLAAMGLVN